jgi:hypothetical protein
VGSNYTHSAHPRFDKKPNVGTGRAESGPAVRKGLTKGSSIVTKSPNKRMRPSSDEGTEIEIFLREIREDDEALSNALKSDNRVNFER